MLRYVVFFLIIFVVFIVAAVFAATNPAPPHIDHAFTALEMSTSLAMIAFLFTGWLFGLLCTGLLQLNGFTVQQQLRKALWIAAAERQSLCSMPNRDAD